MTRSPPRNRGPRHAATQSSMASAPARSAAWNASSRPITRTRSNGIAGDLAAAPDRGYGRTPPSVNRAATPVTSSRVVDAQRPRWVNHSMSDATMGGGRNATSAPALPSREAPAPESAPTEVRELAALRDAFEELRTLLERLGGPPSHPQYGPILVSPDGRIE